MPVAAAQASASHRRHNGLYWLLEVIESKSFVAAGPVSRILSAGLFQRTVIPLGRALLRGSSTYPEVVAHRAGTRLKPKPQAPSLFGLAPCGVCPAHRITTTAVRSLPHFSPLPRCCHRGGMFSVALSVNRLEPGFPDVIRHTALAEFGLSSRAFRR